MEITDIRIRLIEGGNKLKAVASITFDGEFVVNEIKIIEGRSGFFIGMPSRISKDGVFKDIAHPISCEMRAYIEKEILEEYNKSIKQIA